MSAIARFWPITRVVTLFHAEAETVAQAVLAYRKRKSLHPNDKISRYVLEEVRVNGLANRLDYLVPLYPNWCTRHLVLPVSKEGWCAMLTNRAGRDPNMMSSLSRTRVPLIYDIECDGALAPGSAKRMPYAVFIVYRKGKSSRQIMAERGTVTSVFGRKEPFEKDESPNRFDEDAFIAQLAAAGLSTHEDAFYETDASAWGIALHADPKFEFLTMTLAEAQETWPATPGGALAGRKR